MLNVSCVVFFVVLNGYVLSVFMLNVVAPAGTWTIKLFTSVYETTVVCVSTLSATNALV